jgi:hypothetical protein
MAAAFNLGAIYNTNARFPFEIAYPAHPLVIEKRMEAIKNCCLYDPKIIKYELEYLNKKVFKDGYSEKFTTKSGYKYEVAVEDQQLYINCIDDFDKVFEFDKSVLEENSLMDVVCPEQFPAHKSIGNS